MTTNNQELSPEQYRVEVLKRRFAQRAVEYEEEIATLVTQNVQLEQQVKALTEEKDTDEVVSEEDDAA